MVFLRDAGSAFPVPIEAVWKYLDSGDLHSQAHQHRHPVRRRHAPDRGQYSWEQEFEGRTAPFTMRWTSYYPVGIVYEVLRGPLTGSKFFIFYTPKGPRTGVTVVGEFRSRTLTASMLEPAVRRFFAREFEQDRAAMRPPGPARRRPRS
jgi:hypothetical protein